jgi:2'-hydroxyisoflavone reductase
MSSTTRRDFISFSLAAGAAIAMGAPTLARAARPTVGSGKKLKILILGGTGFLGPAIVESAKARGHSLTLFNRGKREKLKGTSFEGVEKFYGNRDPNKNADEADPSSPKGLAQLEAAIKDGHTWDAVIDTSGFYPRIVKASTALLAPVSKTYLFISTISVFAKNDAPGGDENSELATIPDPTVETMGAQFENYGPLKALCEKAAEEAFPGKALNIRPGYIVGVRDDTDRFTYWPVRSSEGGEMLVPGEAAHPVQFIDVRDLADFCLNCLEKGLTGAYNVTGPATPYTWGELMSACTRASKSVGRTPATQVWVPNDWLEKQEIGPGGQLPIYIPPEGEYTGFHQRSIAKAVGAGLTTRPPEDTCKSILEWWPGEIERRVRVTKELQEQAVRDNKPAPPIGDPTKLRAGISTEKQAELLNKWHEEQKK